MKVFYCSWSIDLKVCESVVGDNNNTSISYFLLSTVSENGFWKCKIPDTSCTHPNCWRVKVLTFETDCDNVGTESYEAAKASVSHFTLQVDPTAKQPVSVSTS